jgi:anhydro-N-acetylmuramic acid kinase
MAQRPLLAVGLMSGTSMDGIDAALLETDGQNHVRPLGFVSVPYRSAFRDRLRAATALCKGKIGPYEAAHIAALEVELTDLHAEAARSLLRLCQREPETIDLIGFHGHTIDHAPAQGRTWQIGNGARLAAALGIAVINDFRSADVQAGGQGAPLVPLYHQALTQGMERPLAILNIGGVANVTWLGAGEHDIIAFDTGPGNALMDDLVLSRLGLPYDSGGERAALGQADESLIGAWLNHPYFPASPPKSLDRDAWRQAQVEHLNIDDALATLLAFTAAAAAASLPHLPQPPRRWLAAGGGRHNETLMQALAQRLQAPVSPIDALGWNGDAIEAEAFAYLAVRSSLGLPLSLPGTTGAPRPLTGGRFHPIPADGQLGAQASLGA